MNPVIILIFNNNIEILEKISTSFKEKTVDN